MPRDIIETLLSPAEAAAYAGCSRSQIRRAVDDGTLPCIVTECGARPVVGIREEDLMTFTPREVGKYERKS